jgi:hypothetical protein
MKLLRVSTRSDHHQVCKIYKRKLVVHYYNYQYTFYKLCFVEKGPAADATDASQPYCLLCNTVMKLKRKMISFFLIFPSNGAPVE